MDIVSPICQYGTLRYGGFCACWSGAWGLSCTMGNATPGEDSESIIPDAWNKNIPEIENVYYKLDYDLMANKSFRRNFQNHPTCPDPSSWKKIEEETGLVSLDSTYFDGQDLAMFVSQPFVDGRADGALFLNSDNDSILPLVHCYYPRSVYIHKLVEGCRDVWLIKIPWNVAKNCLWNITEEDPFLVYRGSVIIHNLEWTNLGIWRLIRSVLRVKLTFRTLNIPIVGDENFLFEKIEVEDSIISSVEVSSIPPTAIGADTYSASYTGNAYALFTSILTIFFALMI
jgi:hypothetical protein